MKSKFLKPFLATSVATSMVLGSFPAFAQNSKSTGPKVERPPEFVMLAFDGSRSNQMWELTRNFSLKMKQQNKPVHFTYFISGVYWLTDNNKMLYKGPHHHQGRSDIGFGDDKATLTQRIAEANQAYEEGHEIGSHVNGHFDASDFGNRKKPSYSPWTVDDWNNEFRQFFGFVFDVFKNNGIKPDSRYSRGYAFNEKEIVGFRAPVLGVSNGLWPSLVQNGFKYDTSKVNYTWYWPKKDKYGIWQFPLADVQIAGTGKRTLSMDYNFYYSQSKAKKDVAHKALYKKQMYDTYMNYFNSNYYGKRAPVNIGHHFSLWNDGAYWEAMQEFAQTVCGKPEVRCVTYTEYMNWLNSQGDQKLAAYRAGNFDRMKAKSNILAQYTQPVDVNVDLAIQNDTLEAIPSGSSLKSLKGLTTELSVNGQLVPAQKINLQDIRRALPAGSQVEVAAHVFNSKGVELNSSTHVINGLGTNAENISVEPWEAGALRGDLPQAHEE